MRRLPVSIALALVVLLSGCLPSVRAKVSIPELERAFPTIVDLGLKSYVFRRYNEDPICEAMHHARRPHRSRVPRFLREALELTEA